MSTRVVEGVVQRVTTKVFTKNDGSQGERYSMLVNTGQGEDWFNFGFKKPTVANGSQVRFTLTQRGQYWNGDSDSIEVIKTSQAATPAVMKKAVASADNRQRSIVVQTAYKVAPEIIKGALEHQLITLPAKKADKFDAYMSLIDETAMRLAQTFIDPPEDFSATGLEAEDVSDEYDEDMEYGVV